MLFAAVFTVGAGLLLILSSISKLITLRKYARSFEHYRFIPKVWRALIGYSSPVIELMAGIALILFPHHFLINLIALGMFFVFIAIHVNAVLNNDKSTCMCFGEVIKLRYGMPGIIQSALLILSVLPNILIVNPVQHNQLFITYGLLDSMIALILACIWGLNLLITRMVLDKLLYR